MKRYSDQELSDAVALYMKGTKLEVVLFPERTLTRHALNKVQGKSKQRPGPQPVLTNEIE